MSIDDDRRPEHPVGSTEWFAALGTKTSEQGRRVTTIIETGVRDVLGDTFQDGVLEGLYVTEDENMHNRRRGHSRYAQSFVAITQRAGWDADNPELRFTAASLALQAAERTAKQTDHGDLVVFKLVGGEIVDGKRVGAQRVQVPILDRSLSLDPMRASLTAYAEAHDIFASRQEELAYVAGAPLLPPHRRQRAFSLLQKSGLDALIKYMRPAP